MNNPKYVEIFCTDNVLLERAQSLPGNDPVRDAVENGSMSIWFTVAMFFGRASADSVFKFAHVLEKEHPKSPIRIREISTENGDDRVVYETQLK